MPGRPSITFTVTRSGTTAGAVTADYAVVFGSGPFDAEADDFTALAPLSGQVSFANGETSTTITVSVDGDVGPEVDENFTVLLSNASAGATIGDGTATGTIVNDDGPPPLVTINDVSVVEGNSGSVSLILHRHPHRRHRRLRRRLGHRRRQREPTVGPATMWPPAGR